ncbi:putative type 4 fimbrial biogenesis pilw-related protein transmembrane [Thiocapsa sp. KS1]|nr:PilW family protein [Thiocapsa sp. KS1]CRI67317.1 putative type 4 fimbrial biogenesis pilw-related protein transmembrane [Thiocapsa sp. KS1]
MSTNSFMSKRGSRGFTMIELMIAMLIGILLLGPLAVILANNSQTRYELENSLGQIQNARYALQVLGDDLGNAGFGVSDNITFGPVLTSLPDSCNSTEDILDDEVYQQFQFPVQGIDNLAEPPEDCTHMDNFPVCNDVEGDDVLPCNDLLVIRRASTCAVGEPQCDDFDDEIPHIQHRACGSGPSAFSIIDSDGSVFTERLPPCSAETPIPAPIYRLQNRVYYIAANNDPGDGIPTLKRIDLDGGSVALAAGIEHLHFEYGVDTNDDGQPEKYAHAGLLTIDEWKDVVAVRIYLVARNLQTSGGPIHNRSYDLGQETVEPSNGAFKRQVYSTTVRLNNIAGPRE